MVESRQSSLSGCVLASRKSSALRLLMKPSRRSFSTIRYKCPLSRSSWCMGLSGDSAPQRPEASACSFLVISLSGPEVCVCVCV